MFKLFSRKTTEGVNDDFDWGLDVAPITPGLTEQFQELTLSESYEVILERLDRLEVKIDRLLKAYEN